MRIRTTIHLNVITLHRIARASAKTGCSKTAIISAILHKIAGDNRNQAIHLKRVRYQDKDKKLNWRMFHASFVPENYELLLDLKKVFKKSFSLLVAWGAEKYLDDIIRKLTRSMYNSTQIYYSFSRIKSGIITRWLFRWSIPSFRPPPA